MGCIIIRGGNTEMEEVSIKKFKVVLVGFEKAGKTSILNYMKNSQFEEVTPTVALNVENIMYEQQGYLLCDVSGKFKSIWPHYYENLDALIFVIDSTDKSLVYNVREELAKVNKDLEYHTVRNLFLFNNASAILFYLNKCDLPQITDTLELIEELGLYRLIDQDVIIQKCSARTGEGIWEGLKKLHNFLTHKHKCQQLIGSSTVTTNQNIRKKQQQ